jgi:hypothetical protein
MKTNNLIILFFSLLVFISCNKTNAPDCFKETGTQITVTRTLPPFICVILDANIEMTIKNGSVYEAEITGGENMLDEVKTTVSNGTLTIDNKNKCNFVRGYKHKITLSVTCPDYQYVVTNSIGNIFTTQDFHQDTLYVRSEGGDITVYGTYYKLRTSSHGNGNVYFKGTTTEMYVYMNGTNYLYADNCSILNYVFIESLSIANAYVNAPNSGTLEYHLWKTGNIYYKGNPSIITGKIEGKGTIIKE